MAHFLDERLLTAFPTEQFTGREPFPWVSFEQALRPEAFRELLDSFPSLALFEQHKGIVRADQQRSHDRYYLAFERSIYRKGRSAVARAGKRADGVVGLEDLPAPWQAFIEELRDSDAYRAFAERLLGTAPMTVRFAWHAGFNGSEVSPHRDSSEKIGTHIFYFNTSEDWEADWGGSILVLGDKRVERKNPDVSDFGQVSGVEIRDNRSFLFKNTENAWHGVEPLTSPPGRYRRLFNVIFETPDARPARRGPLDFLFRR